MKNMGQVFKRFFTYKWGPNFISTIFRNEKMETLSNNSFNRIDNGCLTVSNSFFVKLVCSVIIIISLNLSTIDFSSILEVLKNNAFVPLLFLLLEIIPSLIIYTTKKNRYIKRYPKLYYRMLLVAFISIIEIVFSAIYFASNLDNTTVIKFASIVGLIADFATLYGYISIDVGIIDFCIFTNKLALDKDVSKNTDFGDYIDYL